MNTRRERRSAQQWASIIKQFEQSNLSINAFCEQHDFSVVTFHKWRRKTKPQITDESPAFKQVETTVAQNHSVAQSPSIITLQVGPNIRLTIAAETVIA